ncbi:MAG: undecaprenyldiphospho-muramoylpentapeptide beta-N-acetylglucosaminyltransferase [Armatimonadota bacterium]|jgi:UDP-N-acetylglucosamine--N-acetylmuramyl-(pentapeptide) pyrophosphoryl-undecaprenol N-acetylglucosamine transferase
MSSRKPHDNTEKIRVALTGGGTGGHVYPAISIAQALQQLHPGVELLYIGSSHGPEGDIAQGAGLEFIPIPSGPISKSLSLRNMRSLAQLMTGVFRARRVLKQFNPDVVVGTGGYVTAAILLAQRTLGGKIVIHEQNAKPGRTNTLLSKIADKVCVTFDSSTAYLPKSKTEVTGLPIRSQLRHLPAKAEARQQLGLDKDLFTVVAVGGSQGAQKPNEIIAGAWPLIDDGSTQLLHQVGQRNIDNMRAHLGKPEQHPHYHVEAYIDMPLGLAGADLIISRSGGTVAEITAAGKPSILFPYPYHKDQHQKRNAEHLVEHGAAIMCEDLSTTSEQLAEIIARLRKSPGELSKMAEASKSLGKPDAADRVARIVLQVAKTGLDN